MVSWDDLSPDLRWKVLTEWHTRARASKVPTLLDALWMRILADSGGDAERDFEEIFRRAPRWEYIDEQYFGCPACGHACMCRCVH